MKKMLILSTLIACATLPSLAGRVVIRHRVVRPVYHPPTTVVTYRPAVGQIDVNCNVDDAQVFVNGKLAGFSDDFDGFPGKLELKPGQYRIKIKYGEHSRIYDLYVSLGHEINLNVDF